MAMSKAQAIEIIKRVDICSNAAETARDMAIAALQNDTTSFKKVWYKHHTGKQGKRKHLKMMLVCTECHNEIRELPSVDAVEVVRCKDCIHMDKDFSWCDRKWVQTKGFDYCFYGERRSDGQT
jgi:protein-arginine kinase activator protein McsA